MCVLFTMQKEDDQCAMRVLENIPEVQITLQPLGNTATYYDEARLQRIKTF